MKGSVANNVMLDLAALICGSDNMDWTGHIVTITKGTHLKDREGARHAVSSELFLQIVINMTVVL